MTEFSTPIALFVYNRPGHTRRTLESLAANKGAQQSKLYIFSDGFPKDADQQSRRRITEVRRLIREKSWCGDVEIIESSYNKGLASSITNGISRILETQDRIIVLEDDLETSPGFLCYMNDALELYKDERKIFQVSGYNVKNHWWAPKTGFLRVSTSWGWATWKRAWQFHRTDSKNLLGEVQLKGQSEFDLDGYSFHFDELERNVNGDLNTWAVHWYATIFLNDGLCLYPSKTLVRNIGFDGSGVNCYDSTSSLHRAARLAAQIPVAKIRLEENNAFLKTTQRHYQQLLREWTHTTLIIRIRRQLGWKKLKRITNFK